MDASRPSLSGREGVKEEEKEEQHSHAESSDPIDNSEASVPAISVTTMDPSSLTPPPSQTVQAQHPSAQSQATPAVAFSQPSPALDAITSSTSSAEQQPPRNRARARTQATSTSTRQDTPSTTVDAGQAEKQQPDTVQDDSDNGKTKPPSRSARHVRAFLKLVRLDPLPWFLSWIPPNLTWPKLKPVLRSALTAWTCMVIFLIKPAELALGNASFLVLVGSFIQPAEAPLAAVVEREFFTLLFICIAWAWSNIAIAISYAARNNKIPRDQASLTRAIAGDYIEAGPSVVCGVFLALGSAVVLYIKVRFGPGPFLFATVFSCILMNICLTYAPLYPFPFYTLGQSVVVPLALKAAINIFYSIVFFPKSVNSQFVERIVAVLNPVASACSDQVKLLQTSPLDTPSGGDSTMADNGKGTKEGFDFELVRNKLAAAEGGLMPLAMASRLLTREISFGLAGGDDLRELERLTRALIAPADGWAYYYSSIKADLTSAHFRRTPLPSRLATPAITPAITPRTSAEHSREASDSGHASHNAALNAVSTQHQFTHLHQLVPPSRPHSPSHSPLSPLTPLPCSAPAHASHDAHHTLGAASGTSTPHRESPLHGEVFFNDASNAAAKFRQLDEHPSVEPGQELSSSRFRKMARSIAAASRSSSPRRWIHHNHHSTHDVRDHHDSRHSAAWDKSSQILHNFVHKRDPAPVAIWESIRFGNLETYLHTSANNYVTEMFAQLVRETSADLLTADAEAIKHIVGWLTHLNAQRYHFLRDRLFLSKEQQKQKGERQAEETKRVIEGIEVRLMEFKKDKRLKVLDPYRDALRPQDGTGDFAAELDLRTGPGEISKIHHRYLYQAWLHQFHSISFTERLLTLLREVESIQRQRIAAVVWYPHWPKLFSAEAWRSPSADVHNPDEPDGDPNHIPDINDTPVASRQRSRSSQTAVDHDPPTCRCNANNVSHDSPTQERPVAHAHFCSVHDHHSDADATVSDPIMDLGSTRARDPDALDPEGFLQVVGNSIYFWVHRPFHGNALFGVKAAVLIALVSLPAFMKSSAGWCYENRAIWAIFMAQLTLARFRGETAFALMSRLLATITGAIFGLLIWYIATGDGRGNAYGLGATTAVAFPLLMMYRIYFPGPPITPIISSVTTALIVGYSWKDVTAPAPGSPGYGWSTAWRRFVAVAVGVTAAYIFSYLPPSSTLREYQRLSHAATIAELGKIYCAVVGIASHAHQQGNEKMHASGGGKHTQSRPQSRPGSRRTSLHHETLEGAKAEEPPLPHVDAFQPDPSSEVVRKRIIGIRAKLRRLSMISVNVTYEFSLRGRWPSARYQELFETQMQISKLLSHTLAILERLGAAYSIALLRRTRFLDPRFLGDVVSVISMCSTALKTGEPLPQITPCPLVDRFMDTPHGFNAYLPTQQPHTRLDELLAQLPQKISLSTLEDPEYMTFSVGVATLFGLVVRIDKLCVAVKELVGESYAVPADVHRMLSTTK